jgi:hypothetical protein
LVVKGLVPACPGEEENANVSVEPNRTVDACLTAAARGVAWLLDQQTRAGNWRYLETEVFDGYYKGGWALAVSGQLAGILSIIRGNTAFPVLPIAHPVNAAAHRQDSSAVLG